LGEGTPNGSELHDTVSQKNVRARVTDRSELADERSGKVAIATRQASGELERNSQRLKPIPQIACGRTANKEWKEVKDSLMNAAR
jgi:hypothetical protein